MKKIIKIIYNKLPKNVQDFLYKKYYLPFLNRKVGLSYSQQGEDVVLAKSGLVDLNKKGTFIDIGAHHPKLASNTYLFYKKGWSGINIDPIPKMIEDFKNRKRDLNLNIGISDKEGYMNYYIYEIGLYNTLNKNNVENLKNEKKIEPIKTIPIKTKRLEHVLNEYLNNREIDFMSIDVEGNELSVLKSNDWKKYKPKIILIEMLNTNIEDLEKNEIHQYLTRLDYYLFAKTFYTCFYKLK